MERESPAQVWRQCLAEAVGTALILIFGCGSIAAQSESLVGDGGKCLSKCVLINGSWAAGVCFGILVSYDVSGAHLNTAVTINAMLTGGFSFSRGVAYMASQFAGAISGAVIIAVCFFSFQGTVRADHLFNAFCTSPHKDVTFGNAFFVEVVATGLVVLCVSIVSDGGRANKFLVAGFTSFAVFGVGSCFAVLSGISLNPARDLGPRLVYLAWEVVLHQGSDVWVVVWGRGYGLWVPILGPIVGTILASLIFRSLRPTVGSERRGLGRLDKGFREHLELPVFSAVQPLPPPGAADLSESRAQPCMSNSAGF